jgi:hypothetical protein
MSRLVHGPTNGNPRFKTEHPFVDRLLWNRLFLIFIQKLDMPGSHFKDSPFATRGFHYSRFQPSSDKHTACLPQSFRCILSRFVPDRDRNKGRILLPLPVFIPVAEIRCQRECNQELAAFHDPGFRALAQAGGKRHLVDFWGFEVGHGDLLVMEANVKYILISQRLLNITGEDREVLKGMLDSRLTKEKNGLSYVAIDLFKSI